MKAFTDIEQSKKLAEILPIESADMCYIQELLARGKKGEYKAHIGNLIPAYGQDKIPCWSLAALVEVLPGDITFMKVKAGDGCAEYYYFVSYKQEIMVPYKKELIDGIVEILKILHEEKFL